MLSSLPWTTSSSISYQSSQPCACTSCLGPMSKPVPYLWLTAHACIPHRQAPDTSAAHLTRACRADDFYRILTEPEHNMLKQHTALLATEGVDLHFTEGAVREVARVAAQVNSTVDNIGARRCGLL